MIHWLEQTTADHPALARGQEPAGLLADEERQQLPDTAIAKRRQDWLLGRFTAKRLVRTYLERACGLQVPDRAVVLRPDRWGAPSAWLLDEGATNGQSARPLPLSISLSHSQARALCVLCDVPGVQVGADLETVERRSRDFEADYFNRGESELLRRTDGAQRPAMVTAIWSAKEALLKALRIGLAVDTRRVTCLPGRPPGPGWSSVGLRCESEVLAVAGLGGGERGEGRALPMAGWQTCSRGRVRAVAAVEVTAA